MTDKTIRALCVRQPFAEFIVSGEKGIENRRWRTHYRGPVVIIAAKAVHSASLMFPEVDARSLPRGGVVGIVDLVDLVTQSDDEWFSGPVGLVLENARRLPFCPWPGSLYLQSFCPDAAQKIAKGKHPAQQARGADQDGLFR